MAGLLDYMTPEDRQQAFFQSLKPLAGGLISGGAPSTQPGGWQRGLGQGLLGMNQAYQGSLNNRMKQGLLGSQYQTQQLSNQLRLSQYNALRQAAGLPPISMDGAGGPDATAQPQPQQPQAQEQAAPQQEPQSQSDPYQGGSLIGGTAPLQSSGLLSGAPQTLLGGKAGAATAPGSLANMTRDKAMQLAALYAQGGQPEMAKLFSDYALKGVDQRQYGQDGTLSPIPGGASDPAVVSALAGAKAGGTAAGELPYVGPKAAAVAQAQQPYQQGNMAYQGNINLFNERAKQRTVPPAGSVYDPLAGQQGQGGGVVFQSSANPPGFQEKAESATTGAGFGKEYNDLREQASAAAGTRDQIALARAINAPTGKLAATKEAFGGWAQALGVNAPQAIKDATDLQTFTALSSNYVLGKQLEQKGVQSESDAARMRETFANATNIDDANKFIMRAIDSQMDRVQQKLEFYDQYRAAHGNSVDGALKEWMKFVRSTPLVQRDTSGNVKFYSEFARDAATVKPDITADEILTLWRSRAK